MNDDRKKLARQQRDLVAAIFSTTTSEVPASDLMHTTATLKAKRRREVSLSIPLIAEALGTRFNSVFNLYITASPFPPNGGLAADAARFCNFLLTLPDLEREVVLLALVVCTRRGVPLRFAHSKVGLVGAFRGRTFSVWRNHVARA
jgi:hypothetical protein